MLPGCEEGLLWDASPSEGLTASRFCSSLSATHRPVRSQATSSPASPRGDGAPVGVGADLTSAARSPNPDVVPFCLPATPIPKLTLQTPYSQPLCLLAVLCGVFGACDSMWFMFERACACVCARAGVTAFAGELVVMFTNKSSALLFAAMCACACAAAVTADWGFLVDCAGFPAWTASQCVLNGCFNPVVSLLVMERNKWPVCPLKRI